ncbi:hypothetical protein pb186bvf_019353 [Paramecium bursaria]
MNQSTQENTDQQIEEIPQNPNQIVNTLNRQFQELEQKVFEIQINQILEQIMTINNQSLLQKQFLDHFLTFLQIKQSEVLFQDVTNYQQCIQIIDANYLQKKQEFETEFYLRMKVYDELTQKVNLNELEKIMKILKSKQKSIYISKDIQECSCHMHFLVDHKHEQIQQVEQAEQAEQTEQVEENEVKQNVENQEIPKLELIQEVQEDKEIQEISEQKDENKNEQEQLVQNEQDNQQNQNYVNFQSIEDEQQLLYQQTQELFDQYNHIQSQRQQLAEQKQKAEQALQKQRQMEQKIIELQKRQQQLIQELRSESIASDGQEEAQEQQNQIPQASEDKINKYEDEQLQQDQQDLQDQQVEQNQPEQQTEQVDKQEQQEQQQQDLLDQQQKQNQVQDQQEAPNQEQQASEEELRQQIIQSRQQIELLMQQRNDLIQMKEQLSQKQQDLEIQKQLLLEKLEVSQNQADGLNQPAISEQVVKETQTEQDSKLQNISFLDIFNVMQFKNLDSLQRYNDKNKSIVFKLHQNYTVEIKGDDIEPDKPLNQDSLLVQIPPFILTHQILQYLSAFEIFKTRGVCGWWRDQIKQIWPAVFKREMYEQMSSNNLKKTIFRSSLLLKLKYKFAERLNNILRAMFELVNWDELNNQLIQAQISDQNNEEREQSIQIKKCVVSILILLNKIQNIQYLYQIDESVVVEQNAQDLKQLLMDFLSFEQFAPLSISQMRAINLSLLQSPEFELQNVQPAETKNLLYLTIITNQIYYYGFLKNIIKAEQFSIEKQSKEFNILSERLNYNANFLEGAHKIIMRTQTDSNDEEDEGEVEGQQEEEKPLAEAQQFLKSLVNLEQTGEPDIVIKKHKTITRIFIDVNTKLDILVSSMHQSKE